MALEVDFQGLAVGDLLRRTATGEPFIGLLDSDWDGWLDSMLEEIEDAGALYGIEFERISEVVDSVAGDRTRVTGILRVVAVDAEIAEQQAAVFGWAVLLVIALLAAPISYNVAVRGEESLEVLAAGIDTTKTVAVAAIVVALVFVALRFLPGK